MHAMWQQGELGKKVRKKKFDLNFFLLKSFKYTVTLNTIFKKKH